jgi:hypothetical protein
MGAFDMEVAVLPDKAMTQPHAENYRTFWHESATQVAFTHALHPHQYLLKKQFSNATSRTNWPTSWVNPSGICDYP